MLKINFFNLFVIFYFFEISTAFSQESRPFGFLKLKINTPEIRLLINGNSISSVDSALMELPPGVYEIVALNPKRYLWGNIDFKQEVILSANDTITVTPVFPSLLTIRSQPFGAQVYSDNAYLGTTPCEIATTDSTIKKIILKKKGFLDCSLSLQNLNKNCINVLMMPDSKFDNKLINQSCQLKNRYQIFSVAFFGLTLLSGYASVHFKSQADDYYQKYLNAGSTERMNRYYQKCKHNDIYTNIALGVLQVNFLSFFYFLMKSF